MGQVASSCVGTTGTHAPSADFLPMSKEAQLKMALQSANPVNVGMPGSPAAAETAKQQLQRPSTTMPNAAVPSWTNVDSFTPPRARKKVSPKESTKPSVLHRSLAFLGVRPKAQLSLSERSRSNTYTFTGADDKLAKAREDSTTAFVNETSLTVRSLRTAAPGHRGSRSNLTTHHVMSGHGASSLRLHASICAHPAPEKAARKESFLRPLRPLPVIAKQEDSNPQVVEFELPTPLAQPDTSEVATCQNTVLNFMLDLKVPSSSGASKKSASREDVADQLSRTVSRRSNNSLSPSTSLAVHLASLQTPVVVTTNPDVAGSQQYTSLEMRTRHQEMTQKAADDYDDDNDDARVLQMCHVAARPEAQAARRITGGEMGMILGALVRSNGTDTSAWNLPMTPAASASAVAHMLALRHQLAQPVTMDLKQPVQPTRQRLVSDSKPLAPPVPV